MAGLSPEEELSWVQQVFKDSKKEDLDKAHSSESVRKLLASPEIKDYGEYVFNDVKLRHRKYPSTKVRKILTESKNVVGSSDDPMRAQDGIIYQVIADICVDEPFNDPVTWATIDAGTTDGRVYKIFMDLMQKIGGGDKALQTFR
jgi:hypothetical protein